MTTKFMQVLVAYLHVLGVATYLGGSIVMEFVVGPAQQAIPPAQAQVMGQKTADRFLILVWSALGLIAASGILRLYSVDNQSLLTSRDLLLDYQYGRTLLVMLVLWGVLVVNGAIITFVLRPRLTGRLGAAGSATQAQAHTQSKIRAATWVTRLTRADIVIALGVALLGASQRFGGIL